MAGIERSSAPQVRATVLLGLILVTALSVHGAVPEANPIPRRPPQGGVWSVVAVMVMMSVAVVIAGVGLLILIRDQRAHPAPLEPAVEVDLRSPRDRRRMLIIGVAAVAACVAVFALLSVGVGLRRTPTEPAAPPHSGQSDSSGSARQTTAPDHNPPTDRIDVAPVLLVSGSVVLVVFIAGSILVARRNRWGASQFDGEEPGSDYPGSVADSLTRAAERGLAEMTAPGRDPRSAIIACYAAMENGLADAPDSAPQASDTPSEVLARAIGHGALHSNAGRSLADLFTEARFSPHQMTEADRQSAVELLGNVLADLRSPSWAG